MIPEIPKGFATKLGVVGAAILAIVAAITPFIDGATNGDTRFFAALSSLLATATVIGRMLQGAASFRDAPSPQQTYEEPDFIQDVEDVPVGSVGGTTLAPSEQALVGDYPEDPPPLRPTTDKG